MPAAECSVLCDHCSRVGADLFCQNDGAFLCTSCDTAWHTTKITSRHVRVAACNCPKWAFEEAKSKGRVQLQQPPVTQQPVLNEEASRVDILSTQPQCNRTRGHAGDQQAPAPDAMHHEMPPQPHTSRTHNPRAAHTMMAGSSEDRPSIINSGRRPGHCGQAPISSQQPTGNAQQTQTLPAGEGGLGHSAPVAGGHALWRGQGQVHGLDLHQGRQPAVGSLGHLHGPSPSSPRPQSLPFQAQRHLSEPLLGDRGVLAREMGGYGLLGAKLPDGSPWAGNLSANPSLDGACASLANHRVFPGSGVQLELEPLAPQLPGDFFHPLRPSWHGAPLSLALSAPVGHGSALFGAPTFVGDTPLSAGRGGGRVRQGAGHDASLALLSEVLKQRVHPPALLESMGDFEMQLPLPREFRSDAGLGAGLGLGFGPGLTAGCKRQSLLLPTAVEGGESSMQGRQRAGAWQPGQALAVSAVSGPGTGQQSLLTAALSGSRAYDIHSTRVGMAGVGSAADPGPVTGAVSPAATHQPTPAGVQQARHHCGNQLVSAFSDVLPALHLAGDDFTGSGRPSLLAGLFPDSTPSLPVSTPSHTHRASPLPLLGNSLESTQSLVPLMSTAPRLSAGSLGMAVQKAQRTNEQRPSVGYPAPGPPAAQLQPQPRPRRTQVPLSRHLAGHPAQGQEEHQGMSEEALLMDRLPRSDSAPGLASRDDDGRLIPQTASGANRGGRAALVLDLRIDQGGCVGRSASFNIANPQAQSPRTGSHAHSSLLAIAERTNSTPEPVRGSTPAAVSSLLSHGYNQRQQIAPCQHPSHEELDGAADATATGAHAKACMTETLQAKGKGKVQDGAAGSPDWATLQLSDGSTETLSPEQALLLYRYRTKRDRRHKAQAGGQHTVKHDIRKVLARPRGQGQSTKLNSGEDVDSVESEFVLAAAAGDSMVFDHSQGSEDASPTFAPTTSNNLMGTSSAKDHRPSDTHRLEAYSRHGLSTAGTLSVIKTNSSEAALLNKVDAGSAITAAVDGGVVDAMEV